MNYYDDCILFLLAKAYQRVHGLFKNRLKKYGLTPVQELVLLAIYENEGVSAGDIVSRLVLDHATLSGIMDRLADGGWISKKTGAKDRRFLQIYLTPKTKELMDDIVRERDELQGEIMGSLKLEERLLLMRMLKDLRK